MSPLPYAWMGLLCLAIVWACALLVAGAALQDIRALRALRRRLGALADNADLPTSVGRSVTVLGTIESSAGDTFAVHEVDQVGRAKDGKVRGIAFFDRAFSSNLAGGTLRVGSHDVRVEPSATAEVWPALAAQTKAARGTGRRAFDAAYALSRGVKGSPRDVHTSMKNGDQVFVSGTLQREADGAFVLRGTAECPLVVAGDDPHAWARSHNTSTRAFVVLELLAVAGCSACALTGPAFGSVSTLGGVLCLGFFLGVQPIGVTFHDRCRTPNERYVRGEWLEPDEAPGATDDVAEGRSTALSA